jgi:hypothetical protein
MDKLTINELKGYLGTGLTVSIQSELYPNPQVIGIVRDVVYLNYHGSSLSMNIDKIKPYLHPLSSLTEYREDLGFVPIEELAKIAFNYLDFKKLKFENDSSQGAYSTILNKSLSFTFDSNDNSFISINQGKTVCVPNQLELFQKLYEWHFAVNIPEHLYINIKTLKDE